MDHRTIDAENVAERYVTGRLPPEEAARFEEHYLDCPSCCARVEAAERMERGLRRLAEEAAAGSGSRFARAARSPAWGLAAAAVLVLALLPAGFEGRRAARLERDLAAAKGELARSRAAAQAPSRARAAVPAPNRADALAGELAEARRDLAQETARREELAREVEAGRRPQADLPLLRLSPLRGGGEEPVRTLTLPRKPGWIALWIEPGGDEAPAYRATLADAHGKAVLDAPRLALNDLGALLLTVHSSTLVPGRYRLDVDALGAGAATSGQRPVASFAIQVAPPR